jgi:hypothetical protein
VFTETRGTSLQLEIHITNVVALKEGDNSVFSGTQILTINAVPILGKCPTIQWFPVFFGLPPPMVP